MLITEHTIEDQIDPVRIWKLWGDVAHWNMWASGVEYSTIDGPFQKGAIAVLKLTGGPEVRITFIEVDPMRSFVTEARLPLTTIIVSHWMRSSGGATSITHRIEMKGALSWLFALLIGRGMKKKLPDEMRSLVKIAKEMP